MPRPARFKGGFKKSGPRKEAPAGRPFDQTAPHTPSVRATPASTRKTAPHKAAASKRKPTGNRKTFAKGSAAEYEIEALAGLEAVALEELQSVPELRDLRGGRFWFPGDPTRLTRLRGSVAVYRVKTFEVPRPKALLGHQLLQEVVSFVRGVLAYGGHKSFRISAAGRESSTMQRLAEELSKELGISHDPEEGELLLRLRPTENPNMGEADPETGERLPVEGWDILARLTPRPLSARAWRVCNRAGGLNATVAYAMLKLAGVREADRIFNPMMGSGTLLIERDLLGPSAALVGVDIDAAAVECARQNIQAAGRNIEAAQVDALQTGLPPRSFDLIVCDLPWGDAITVEGGNEMLYLAFLKEMHRLLSRQGRMVIITHEIRLFERLISEQDRWYSRELFQVYSGGHHPKAYLLSRK